MCGLCRGFRHRVLRQAVKGLLERAVFLELLRCAVEDHPPIVDEQNPVGDSIDLLKNVGRDQNGFTAPELLDVVPEMPDLIGIQSGGGLVHDQNFRIVKERLGETDPLP